METPVSETDYSKFGGMVSVADPRDVPPGQSTLQINAMAVRPGELLIRSGLKELTFEDD